MPEYILVHTPQEYSAAAKLFTEYAAWLNIDLGFQHFESELKELSQMYAAPTGGIILCKEDENYIACVAIRKIDAETAELKRMYVQSDKQGKGIGKTILTQAIEMARGCGYQRIRLDTLDHMTAASCADGPTKWTDPSTAAGCLQHTWPLKYTPVCRECLRCCAAVRCLDKCL